MAFKSRLGSEFRRTKARAAFCVVDARFQERRLNTGSARITLMLMTVRSSRLFEELTEAVRLNH